MTANIVKMKNGLSGTKTIGGDLRLPDGRRIEDVRGAELNRILRELNIEGVTAEAGKQDCALAYVKHFDAIKESAGESAIVRWLEQHRPQLKMGRAE